MRKIKFTLIELLVVVAIIGILASILLPALSRSRRTAYKIVCTSNQKQLMTGTLTYETDYEKFPQRGAGGDENRGFTMLHIAPYMNAKTEIDAYASSTPEWVNACTEFFRTNEVYQCPARSNSTRYLGYTTNTMSFDRYHSIGSTAEDGLDSGVPNEYSSTVFYGDVFDDFLDADDFNSYNIYKKGHLPWKNGVIDLTPGLIAVWDKSHSSSAPLTFWDGHVSTRVLKSVSDWPPSLVHGSPEND
jgi:prepilin-type N-terminal cleavage/methylation domain-containing protein/prepilin-type processing-associated H-X9-DG protein